MSIFSILYTLIISPLELFFEVIFSFAYQMTNNQGVSILILSLCMNFLVLPLYRRADIMQDQEHEIEAKLQKGVEHIKKTFHGDEKMMILNTYYRQNHYKPTYVLRGSVSLFLQIPFFMAAYHFLSNLEILQGTSLGPISNLGEQDGLLVIGTLTINLLPVLMTTINLISSHIYTKGYPVKTKVQLYVMALAFFVFLYRSPSGLVFYWTLNNTFSLFKTIICKILKVNKKNHEAHIERVHDFPDVKRFLTGALILVLLLGVLIPSAVIESSPEEFVDVFYFYHPVKYIIQATLFAAGFFVVWMGVFYWLANEKGKIFFERGIFIFVCVAIINYMFFGKKLGLISANLKYDNAMSFSNNEIVVNILVLCALIGILLIFMKRIQKSLLSIELVGSLVLIIMCGINITSINTSISELKARNVGIVEEPRIPLSTQGKNVVVIMMDRAMGEYIPYMIQEKPELMEMFSGFTYYPNTISFGAHTIYGSSAVFGGYEYTPYEMNQREEERLVDKHNEALKVMPTLFAENDYEVTVCDPVMANYKEKSDTTVFQEMPFVHTYVTQGRYNDIEARNNVVEKRKRNFFCMSLVKVLPVIIQTSFYDEGNYHQMNEKLVTDEVNEETEVYQRQLSNTEAIGIDDGFMSSYNVLVNLPNICVIENNSKNTFVMLSNEATHETMMLQEPEYIVSSQVDNTEYENENRDRYTVNGVTLRMDEPYHYRSYQSNMASLLQLGKWCDYLKVNGVYDNTRIIIVADHGYSTKQISGLFIEDTDGEMINLESFMPLLLVKDFECNTFSISGEFMTNADVPAIATRDILENPSNPFTSNRLDGREKTEKSQYIINSHNYAIGENIDNNTFYTDSWISVHDSIWNIENWKLIQE